MTQEEFLVRLGVDPTSLDAGTQLAVGRQKKYAAEVSDAWAVSQKSITATAKTQAEIRDANEDYLNKKSLARLAQRTEAERTAAAEWTANYSKRAAERDEIAAIGNGSGGYSMVGKNGEKAGANAGMSANMAAQILASGGSLKDAGLAVGGVAVGTAAAKAAEHAVNSTAIRETFVIFREGLRRNFSRIIGSFSILATSLRIGASVLAGIVVDLPLIATGVYQFLQMRKAAALEKSSGENLKTADEADAGSLRQMISELNRAGKISDSDAAAYGRSLKNPTYENVRRVQNDLFPLMKDGTAKQQLETFEAQKEKQKEMARLDEEHQKKMDEYYHENADIQTRYESDLIRRFNIMEQMGYLEKNSVEYKQKQLELDDANRAIQEDLKTLAEKKAEAAAKELENNNEATNLSRRIGQNQREMEQMGAEYPSIEDEAGRTFTRRLAAQYGKGGRYDLGRGDGAFADTARDYERAKYQQQYDRTYGNIGAADQDRQRMISARDFLIQGGAASPEMQLSKIQENTAAMQTHLDALINKGAKINVDLETPN